MWRDLWQGVRALGRTPLVSAVVVASLGIGIGVNTAVFSWIQVFVLRPLPGVAAASEFHLVEARAESGAYPGSSWQEYLDLRARVPSVRDLIAFRMAPLNVGETTRAERVFGLLVSGNYFSSLGLRPALGRFVTSEDTSRAGGAPVAVVSHGFWQAKLSGDSAALGRSIRANGVDLTVVGVAPDGFQGTVLGLQFDVWVPATMAPVVLGGSRELEDRNARGYYVMGRLPTSALRHTAGMEVDAAMRALADAYPSSNRAVMADVLPFWKAPRGPQGMFLEALGVLQGLMLLLLLAVCGNTATLLLARGASRQRDIGIRLAIGSGRGRVIRLLLAESLVLGVAGAALGVVVAWWSARIMASVTLTTALPVRFQVGVDGLGLLVALLLGVACAVAFGLAPAWQLATLDVHASVAAGGRLRGSRVRRAAMGLEVALAMVVLIVAGLFVKNFSDAKTTHPGFERDGVLLAAYDLSARGADAEASRVFAGRALERLAHIPGVSAAAIATSVPLDIHGLPQRAFSLEGRARTDGATDQAFSNTVTPGYFATMGIPWVSGADFVELTDTVAPAQAVVNQAFVDRYLAEGAVLGRQLEQGGRIYAIIGVVKTSLSDSFGEAPAPCMYFSYRDRPARSGEMHLRTRPGAEASLTTLVRAELRALDPALPVFNVRTLSDHVDTNLFLRRIPARLFLALGPLLLALAAVGIYAVVAHTVASRTSEIGVRLALGATTRRVVREVVTDSFGVIGLGAAAGWVTVWVVYSRLFGASLDWLAFGAVPVLLLAVAFVSSWLPARRAATIDPAAALKSA